MRFLQFLLVALSLFLLGASEYFLSFPSNWLSWLVLSRSVRVEITHTFETEAGPREARTLVKCATWPGRRPKLYLPEMQWKNQSTSGRGYGVVLPSGWVAIPGLFDPCDEIFWADRGLPPRPSRLPEMRILFLDRDELPSGGYVAQHIDARLPPEIGVISMKASIKSVGWMHPSPPLSERSQWLERILKDADKSYPSQYSEVVSRVRYELRMLSTTARQIAADDCPETVRARIPQNPPTNLMRIDGRGCSWGPYASTKFKKPHVTWLLPHVSAARDRIDLVLPGAVSQVGTLTLFCGPHTATPKCGRALGPIPVCIEGRGCVSFERLSGEIYDGQSHTITRVFGGEGLGLFEF